MWFSNSYIVLYVLLHKVCKTNDPTSCHCVIYGRNYSEIKFLFFLGTSSNQFTDNYRSSDPTLRIQSPRGPVLWLLGNQTVDILYLIN